MKYIFTLITLVCFTIGAAMAQDNTSTTRTKPVTSKEALKKVSVETAPTQKAQVERKMESAKRVEATQTRPVIEMTDEYIDNQISEIQKVIDKNVGNEEFNLSGYQKRILYLESRRPQK